MQPMMPTLTFPNHYTLVTGLTPVHHGIVNNNFRDSVFGWFRYQDSVIARQSQWWGGEPVWVTAERQGVRAGMFFWVGSEVVIQGVRPTFYKHYDERVPYATRVDTVLTWLSRTDSLRVRLASLYFNNVDHMSHDSGPGSPQALAAALAVDSAIGRLVEGLRRMGLEDRVNVIVVSDHGHAPTDTAHVVVVDDYLDPAMLEVATPSPFVALRPRDGDVPRALTALRRVPHLTVYPRDSTPEPWRYRGNPRVSEIVGVMDENWVLGTRAFFALHPARIHGGEHGYDNILASMQAMFVAAGPAFRRGAVVAPFQNIHVYDLLCGILGLTPAPNDGSPDSTRALLH